MELLLTIAFALLLMSLLLIVMLFGQVRGFTVQLSMLRLEMDSKQSKLTETLSEDFSKLQTGNESKLTEIQTSVNEKLQSTLAASLDQSYRQVSDRLSDVQKGLGEMQTLAAGVGDLKQVLSNVKLRGTWAEVQLGALLEQILSQTQYEKNVAVAGGKEFVEYAIKLPGAENQQSPLWLPIDAKFPVEAYLRLVEASERAEAKETEKAAAALAAILSKEAKRIKEKYISPPATTDFAIMYLPTEGLYSEAIRRPGFAEEMQREQRVVIAGPNTLSALLTSLQVGFRTLAIQKRTSDIQKLFLAIQASFAEHTKLLAKLNGSLEDAQKLIQDAHKQTEKINRALTEVNSEPG